MLNTILSAFTVPDIRRKLGFTALLLALYRLGSHIPVPGINTQAVHDIQTKLSGNGILGFLNLFSGGGLSRIAIFALGIMPYITASIILQLLTVVVPSLEKLQKEGEVGQARITQYTRYLTVGLAFAQSIGYVFLFRSLQSSAGESVVTHFDLPHIFLIVISLTSGTVLLMWMGELITQRGIGNGISLMIFASIVSRLPAGLQSWWTSNNQVFKVMVPFIVLAVVASIVFVQEGQRRIPVPYAGHRAAHDAGGTDLSAAAREHGRRHPGDLRRLDHGLPADRRPADQQALGTLDLGLLHPQRLALHRRRVPVHHRLHLLLHGGDLQSG
jgi:preprotein translocase subunit SecY